MPLRLQLQGIKLDFFILLLKFALIKFHRYIIMELDKSKILTIICSYSKLNTQNITKIQRLYGNSYSDELTHCNHSILIVQRQVSEPTRKWTTCCYLRTLGKDLVLFNTSIKVTVQLNEECREICWNAKLINRWIAWADCSANLLIGKDSYASVLEAFPHNFTKRGLPLNKDTRCISLSKGKDFFLAFVLLSFKVILL